MTTNDSNEPKLADVVEQLVDLKRQIKSIKKMLCLVLVILILTAVLMVLACLGGCQTLLDAKDGLANVTGTATEPPSAFTPTETEEPTPEPVTTPSVIMQEVFAEEEEGGNYKKLSNEEAAALSQKLHDTYLQSIPVEKIDCRSAYMPTKADYPETNPIFDDFIYYELPQNLYAQNMEHFKNNREILAELGEEKVFEYVLAACLYAENQYGWDETYKEDYFTYKEGDPSAESISLFTDEFIKGVRDRRKNDCKNQKIDQDARAISSTSLVYVDGEGNIRVRMFCEDRTNSADENGRKALMLNTDEKLNMILGTWVWHVDEAVLLQNEDGKIEDVILLPITDAFVHTDEEHVKNMNKLYGEP